MPWFTYTCLDARTGREKSGRIESLNAEQAVLKLKAGGLHPTMLVPADAPLPGRPARARGRGRRISRSAVAHVTRQLAVLLRAGMPLLRSLEVLAKQERNPRLRAVLDSLGETIREGGRLSEGLQRHPRVFNRLYVAMVRAGEAAGALEVILSRLAQFLEKAEKVKGRVRAALVYPFIVALVAGGIVTALMMFVVPRFEAVFATLLGGQRLPALTAAVLAVGNFVRDQAIVVLVAGALTVVGGMIFARTRACDWLALRLPVLGHLVLKHAVARFTRTLGTLLNSGVPILPALLITRETSGNACVAAAITTVHDRVEAGEPVAAPLAATRVFPDLVPGMIEVGEETGALPEMLGRIADNYDEEVDNAVAGVTALIEPLMIVVMAVVVGTIVISLFLPIVRIIQSLT